MELTDAQTLIEELELLARRGVDVSEWSPWDLLTEVTPRGVVLHARTCDAAAAPASLGPEEVRLSVLHSCVGKIGSLGSLGADQFLASALLSIEAQVARLVAVPDAAQSFRSAAHGLGRHRNLLGAMVDDRGGAFGWFRADEIRRCCRENDGLPAPYYAWVLDLLTASEEVLDVVRALPRPERARLLADVEHQRRLIQETRTIDESGDEVCLPDLGASRWVLAACRDLVQFPDAVTPTYLLDEGVPGTLLAPEWVLDVLEEDQRTVVTSRALVRENDSDAVVATTRVLVHGGTPVGEALEAARALEA